jgi:hypothetical protein
MGKRHGLCFLVASLISGVSFAADEPTPVTVEEAVAIGTEAYIYAYPLVTMEMTRRVMTNTATAGESHAPMGQFARSKRYPDASFRDVTAPNADTLYSPAWLDLTQEPYLLSLPDVDRRYYLMPMLSGWTDVFAVPGTRSTGNRAQRYVITGPNWSGTLPAGFEHIKAPTNLVWMLGRTYCTGTPEDYREVHSLMDQYSLMPLSALGRPYTPSPGTVDPTTDMTTPVRDQVNGMTAATYFRLFARLMRDNPPAEADAPILARIARIGLAPGRGFDANQLEGTIAAVLETVPTLAIDTIMNHFRATGTHENGWTFTTKTGLYGTDYLQRALITAIGLGANRPQDAVYPVSESDADGQPYRGSNQYLMHFDKGQMPPADAFWSLTMYNSDYFFVANPLNRFTLSSRDKFVENADGSVDLYVQHENPGPEREANWLPAPQGKFVLMLRMYWPRETPPSILDGTWKIPPVKKVAP